MHKSLVKPALGLTLASLLSSSSASPLQQRQQEVCTEDPIYLGLWSNTYVYKDVQTYCASVLGESATTVCDETNIETSTIFGQVTATSTVTLPTYIPATTVTVITTAVNFELRKRGPQPAFVTAVNDMVKRQVGPTYTASAISSACECGNPDPGTTYELCTSTTTKTLEGFYKTTVFTPVTSGTTTITETINVTQPINTSKLVVTTTSASSWALNWTDWLTTSSAVSSTTDSSDSSSGSGYSTTQEIEPTYVSTTTTSAMASATPSGCPADNGTIFRLNSATCYDYEYVCGRTYADSDFSDAFRFPTPEACTAVCDAQNAGSGPGACLAIVWNTTAAVYNCRTLKSLDSPLDDAASVALLLVPDTSCGNTTSSTTSTTSTRSKPSGTGTWTGPWDGNGTGIWTPTGTWTSRPTGFWRHPHHSYKHTVNATSYTTSMNATSYSTSPVNMTTTLSRHTPSSGTGTGMPTMMSNSSCLASTVTSNYTITAVVISSVTQYANATTTSTDFVTDTVFETTTSTKTKKTASTVTDTSTVTITPSASTITVIETSSFTDTVTQAGLTITVTDMGATITLPESTETVTTTTTVEQRNAPTTSAWGGKMMGRKWVAWD